MAPGARPGALDRHRSRARVPAEERRSAYVHAGRARLGAVPAGERVRVLRRARARPGRARPFARRRPDRLRHRLHRRRADLRPPGRRARPHHRGGRVAGRRGRDGGGRRAAGAGGGIDARVPAGHHDLSADRRPAARHLARARAAADHLSRRAGRAAGRALARDERRLRRLRPQLPAPRRGRGGRRRARHRARPTGSSASWRTGCWSSGELGDRADGVRAVAVHRPASRSRTDRPRGPGSN